MRFLAAIFVLIASVSSALGQTRQPAQVSTIPANPQIYELLDKNGKWIGFGSAVDGKFQDLSKAINPVSFGAKCDGVTDDDAALHTWAAAFKENTQAIVPGVCVFTTPIIFPAVPNVSITGNGTAGTLLYKGTRTTGDLITMGISPSVNNGTCLVGWTINGLKIQSNTNMTGGTGVKLNFLCEANIANFDVGGGIGGNENFWDAVWFRGGNSIRIRGFSFRGTGVAETITGWSINYRSVDIMHMQGILSHSGIGLLLGGGAAGTIFDQTDILLNGTNVWISQDRLASFNAETFFGPNVFIDVPDFSPGRNGTGVGILIDEPLANPQFSVLQMTGTWISGGRQCILIQPESRWTVKWTGGLSHICVPQPSEASVENRSINARVILDGVRFYQPFYEGNTDTAGLGTKGPYIEQISPSYYGAQSMILNDVRMEANTYGLTTGDWVGNYFNDAGENVTQDTVFGDRIVEAAPGRSVFVGVDWGGVASCGIKWATGVLYPNRMNLTSAPCTFDLGASVAPFRNVWASIFSAPSGATTIESQSGPVNIESTGGRISLVSTDNISLMAKSNFHTVIGAGSLATDCALWIRAGIAIPGKADSSSAPTPPCIFKVGIPGYMFEEMSAKKHYGYNFIAPDNAPVTFGGNGGIVNITSPGNALKLTSGDNLMLTANSVRSVVISSGNTFNDCALWIQDGLMVPGHADGASAGCSARFLLGNPNFPFGDIHIGQVIARGDVAGLNPYAVRVGTTNYYGESDDTVNTSLPTCNLKIKGGLIIDHDGC